MRLTVAVAAIAVAASTLAGCQASGGTPAGAPTGGASSTGPAETSPPATSAPPSESPPDTTAAALPDVCAMLSRTEVSTLTGGKSILSVDPDPGPGSPVRYCQWQLSGARVGVQLSTTTDAQFRQDHPTEPVIAGLGDDAFFFSDHLFVRKATTQIDVYASNPDPDRQLAKAIAAIVVTRLRS